MSKHSDKAILDEALTQLSIAFGEFSTALKNADRKVWESWKAGGYIVSDNIVSMYPSAQEAVDGLEDCEEEEEEVELDDETGETLWEEVELDDETGETRWA